MQEFYDCYYGERIKEEHHTRGRDNEPYVLIMEDMFCSISDHFHEALPDIIAANGLSIKTMRYLKGDNVYYSPLRRLIIDANRAKLRLPPLHYHYKPMQDEEIRMVTWSKERKITLCEMEIARWAAKDEKAYFYHLGVIARRAARHRLRYVKHLDIVARKAARHRTKYLRYKTKQQPEHSSWKLKTIKGLKNVRLCQSI